MKDKEKRNDNMMGIEEGLVNVMQWYASVFLPLPETLEVVVININKNNKITINNI